MLGYARTKSDEVGGGRTSEVTQAMDAFPAVTSGYISDMSSVGD